MHDAPVRFDLVIPTPMGPAKSFVSLPAGPARLSDLVAPAQQLTMLFADKAEEHENSEGRAVSCRAGCGACCRQLVVISPPEAFYLRDLIARMDDARRQQVTARFAAAVEELEARNLVHELLHPSLSEEPPHIPVVVDYFRLNMACPFLEDESCGIHASRPVPCRDYSVTTSAELCVDPYNNPVRKIPMPIALTAPLAYLTAELSGDSAQLIPLTLALQWTEEHADLSKRTWPAQQLLEGLLKQIGKSVSEEQAPRQLPVL